MGFGPSVYLFGVLGYAVVIAVVMVLAYLVIRFAIRDGLRAHARWLARQSGAEPAPPD